MSSTANYTAKTFFNVIHSKSLVNMGINPDFEHLDALQSDLEQAFREIGGNHYTAICKSAEGLYHIHDAVSFEKAKRVKAVAELFGKCHVEEMRGSKEQAADYINKVGKFAEKGEEVLRVFGDAMKLSDNSGQRVDLEAVRSDIRAGKVTASTIDQYILDNAKTETQARQIEALYNRMMQIEGLKPRNLEVIYVEGETGSGKTRGAYERYTDIFKASVSNKTNFPFNGYRGQKVLLLDELRQGVFSPAELFQILDRYPLQVDVKGGRFPAMWTTVVITTAMPLEDWYTSEDKGQDNNKRQFERRISRHYKAVNGEWRDFKDACFIDVSDEDTPFT